MFVQPLHPLKVVAGDIDGPQVAIAETAPSNLSSSPRHSRIRTKHPKITKPLIVNIYIYMCVCVYVKIRDTLGNINAWT